MKIIAPLLIVVFLCSCSSNWERHRYGSYKRNVLDFRHADGMTRTPVLLCVHGGGFVWGDKRKFRRSKYTGEFLKNGISVATANYRYIRGKEKAPFPGPMMDIVRAIQYLRHNADRLRIDPDRIALFGGSAGGNICLWIALNRDFADPSAPGLPQEDLEDEVSSVSPQKIPIRSGSGSLAAKACRSPRRLRRSILVAV